jgi:putative ABC transport system substrate-binding protein
VDALYLAGDPLTRTSRVGIITLAFAARLPTIFPSREMAESGGLGRTADYVDKVLRGSKPADLSVEQPNLTTAKALGLDVPPTLLAIADEVIE